MPNRRNNLNNVLAAYLILGVGLVACGCSDNSPSRPPAALPDTTETRAPMEIQDLRITGTDYAWLELAWESAGDSSSAVTEFFDLRYALEPLTPENWAEANKYRYVPEPDTVGATHTCRIGGLSPGVEYHFVMKSGHSESGMSPASNQVSGSIKRMFAEAVPVAGIVGVVMFVADVDGDGDEDLATSSGLFDNKSLNVYLNEGEGVFSLAFAYDLGVSGVYKFVIADFDGDERPDLVLDIGQHFLHLMRNLGNGNFSDPEVCGLGGNGEMCAGDFDSDGDMDLAVVTPPFWDLPGSIAWIANDGAGYFDGREGIFSRGGVPYIESADLDGDDDADLIIQEYDGFVHVMRNDGLGVEWTDTEYAPHSSGLNGLLADLNDDGLPDLVMGGNSIAPVLLNAGNATFVAGPASLVGSLNFGLAAADFDGDGDLDIASTWGANGFLLCLNRGDGGLEGPAQYEGEGKKIILGLPFLAASDFDGDGDQDLFVSSGGEFWLILNDPEPLE